MGPPWRIDPTSLKEWLTSDVRPLYKLYERSETHARSLTRCVVGLALVALPVRTPSLAHNDGNVLFNDTLNTFYLS